MGEPTPQQPVTPAGWYPDPAGSGQQRYFDGSTWTANYAPPAGATMAGPPPKKSNRGKIILGVVGAVVVLLVVVGLAGGGGDDSGDTAAPAPTSESAPAPGTEAAPAAPAPPISAAPPVSGTQVTYEVQSDESLLSVTYFNEINDLTQLADQPANWSTSFEGEATFQMHSISAQTNGTQVSCRITVGGDVLVEESATGRFAVVTCAG